MHIASVLFVILVAGACGNPNQEKALTVKKMQEELQGYEDMISGIDVEVVREMQHEYGVIMKVIQSKYIADSAGVDQHYGRMVNMYKGVKKSKGYQVGVENALIEIAAVKTQLENLYDDVTNQDIANSDTIKQYVEIERASLDKVKLVAEKLQLNFEILMSVQDTVYPYMQGIVDSLNKIR
jgi:hypothetical protein